MRAIGVSMTSTFGRVKCVVPHVGNKLAFAAHRVVRRELAAQLRIFHLRFEERAVRGLTFRAQRIVPATQPVSLERQIDLQARQRTQPAAFLQPGIEVTRARKDFLRHHVLRGSLIEIELGNFRRDLRDELHRAGAASDHSDGLSLQREVVIPVRGVKTRTFEPRARPGMSGMFALLNRPTAEIRIGVLNRARQL